MESGTPSTDLAPGSRAEWAIEKLVGFGLVDDRLVAVRPWSRAEASRLADEARDNLDRLGPDARASAEAILELIAAERLDAKVHAVGGGGATYLDSPWLPVPTGTRGGIDARVNHLVRYRGGRLYADGETLAGTADLGAVLGGRFAVQATPRGLLSRGATTGWTQDAQLLTGQVRAQWGNLRLDIGRSSSVWGPGRHGGTLLSDNARGFDRLRLSSDRPFRWPGFLRALGPSQAEIFVALLEADRDIPRARLVGYTVAVRPHPLVEAWFSTLIQSGGEGSPSATPWERLADHLLLIDWIFNGGETFLFSNKGTSVGFRTRVPALRHAQLFLEFTLEDRAHNLRRLFWQDAAWLVGAWIPRLDRAGLLELRVEYHHGGIGIHRHGQFTSGRTLDRIMYGMGEPATNAAFVALARDDGSRRLGLEVAVENRSDDRWRVIRRTDGGIDVWEKTEDRPDELYLRALLSLTAFAGDGRELAVGVGVQRVSDSRYHDGAVRHDGVVEVTARIPLNR